MDPWEVNHLGVRHKGLPGVRQGSNLGHVGRRGVEGGEFLGRSRNLAAPNLMVPQQCNSTKQQFSLVHHACLVMSGLNVAAPWRREWNIASLPWPCEARCKRTNPLESSLDAEHSPPG